MINHLPFEWCELVEQVAAGVPTPFYLFSSDILHENIKRFKQGLQIDGRKVALYYSVKTNPLTDIVRHVQNAEMGILASSYGDLMAARDSNVCDVIFDAPLKSPVEMKLVSEFVNAIVVFENELGLQKFFSENTSRDLHSMRIGLRIAIPSAITGHKSRFGFNYTEVVNDKFCEQMKSGGISNILSSLHFHSGAYRPSHEQFFSIGRFAGDIWNRFARRGVLIPTLNMGGGIPGSLSLEALKLYSDAVKRGLLEQSIPEYVSIIFEPGRGIVEDSGVFCVTVCDICVREEMPFVLVNGGSNMVMPAWMVGEANRFIFRLKDQKRTGSHVFNEATVVGPLCAENDILGQCKFPFGVSIGDLLVVTHTGGYDWSTQYYFGGHLPPAFMIDGSGAFNRMSNRIGPMNR